MSSPNLSAVAASVGNLVGVFLQPLLLAVDKPASAKQLIRELGYDLQVDIDIFQDVVAPVDELLGLLDALDVAVDASDVVAASQSARLLLAGTAKLINDFEQVSDRLEADLVADPTLGQTDLLVDLPGLLFDYLFVRFLEQTNRTLFAALALAGVIVVQDVDSVEATARIPHRRRRVAWNRLGGLLADPVDAVASTLVDGGDLLFEQALYWLQELAAGLGLPAGLRDPDDDILELLNVDPDLIASDIYDELVVLQFPFLDDPLATLGVDIYPLVDRVSERMAGLALAVRAGVRAAVPISDSYQLEIGAEGYSAGGFGLRLPVGDSPTFVGDLFGLPQDIGAGQLGRLTIGVTPTDEANEPVFRLSVAALLDLTVGSAEAHFGLEAAKGLDLFAEANLRDVELLIRLGTSDGFVGGVVDEDSFGGTFDLGLRLSSLTGLTFSGSAQLQLLISLDQSIGAVAIGNLLVQLLIEGNRLTLLGTTSLEAELGPVNASIEGLGIRAIAELSDDRSGNFGLYDASVAFEPPTGLGISIDAGSVKGGGFITHDEQRGRYSGMLQLEVFSVSVAAIGVLDTKDSQGGPLPDGFSFLVIIAAEFPPIQVGFGFVLTGIGGLLGIYRDSDYEALRAGLTTGALDSVMFPEDPIANADRIIDDLSTLFPAKPDRYIIGPMLKLGWGTPTLIRLEVGVLIVFGGPVRVQLLGQLSTELPSSDAALIKLKIDVIGEVDFGKGTVKIDATLRDSSLVGFPLTGDMVARARWKDDPMFGLSFGGFHPDYRPRAAFPKEIRRLALSIAEGSNLRIAAEAYLAVTSNSVQFGTRAELYAAAGGFSVRGDFETHMLIVFDPFGFEAAIAMRVALRFKGKSFASLSLAFELSGPRPWRAKGKLKIKIVFVTFKLKFNVSWGTSTPMLGPPIDVWNELEAAMQLEENWTSVLPATGVTDVLLLPRAEPGKVIVHPHGRLEMRQRVVPFDVEIDKFGSGQPAGDVMFAAPKVQFPGGSETVEPTYLEDYFASGQYKALSEDEKLSAPSFELMRSGIAFGSESVAVGSAAVPQTGYETKIVGPNSERRPADAGLDTVLLPDAAMATLNQLTQAPEVRASSLSASRYTVLGRKPAVAVKPERVKVLDGVTGRAGAIAAPSWLNARDFLNRTAAVETLRHRPLTLINASERP